MGGFWLRGLNWCRRFRHRCGYGVHSPSDFFLITFVIYEQAPYYAFASLHHLRRVVSHLPHYREKVDRFLFRLANYLQPVNIVEVGTGSGLTTRYIAEACPKSSVLTISDMREESVERIFSSQSNITYLSGNAVDKMEQVLSTAKAPLDLIHVADIPDYREVVEKILPFVHERTCLVVANPYGSEEKKRWWKEVLLADQQVRVTFDLYDVGLVFFDKKRAKENHIVNFL